MDSWKGPKYASLSISSENHFKFRIPEDTQRKFNVHKTFRRRRGRHLTVLCTFKLRPVSTGMWGLGKHHCRSFDAHLHRIRAVIFWNNHL